MILDNNPEDTLDFVSNKVNKLKKEVIKEVRYGNYKLDTQLKRDIELIN